MKFMMNIYIVYKNEVAILTLQEFKSNEITFTGKNQCFNFSTYQLKDLKHKRFIKWVTFICECILDVTMRKVRIYVTKDSTKENPLQFSHKGKHHLKSVSIGFAPALGYFD